MVVDRLSKYGHFTPLKHPYTAAQVAQTFFKVIFKLHGIPSSIVCDKDPVITGIFWCELFHLHGTKFNFSSAYHPQIDGQTEVVNRTIEMYLRCFTSSSPKQWAKWLPWVEYCYTHWVPLSHQADSIPDCVWSSATLSVALRPKNHKVSCS